MKDSIDFGSMNISTLFRKLLIPTVLGMVFSALFVITDGIFVGKGIGSDALAAVNITAPLFMIAAGIGLMFGVGASVVASIHLSQGKRKVASINITQAIAFSALLILILSALCLYFIEPLARLLGSSDRLLPLAVEYRDRKARHLRVEAKRGLHREADGVGLDGVEDETVGNGEEHREDAREEGGADHVADVVGGTAEHAALLVLRAIGLREHGFGEDGCHAEEGRDPEPEERARTARHEGRGRARNVVR